MVTTLLHDPDSQAPATLTSPTPEPGHGWRVESGMIELYWMDDTAGVSGRHFLAAVCAGGVVLGIDDAAVVPPIRIVALSIDARVIPFRIGAESSELLGSTLDGWVGALTACTTHALSGATARSVVPGEAHELGAGEIVYARLDPVWVGVRAGIVRQAGVMVAAADQPQYLPVTRAFSVESVEAGTRVTVNSAAEVARDPALAASLAGFHKRILTDIVLAERNGAVRDNARRTASARADQATITRSLTAMSAVLDGSVPSIGNDGHDPLMAACRIVASELGIAVQLAAAARVGRRPPDPVAAIALASKVRVRPVLLRGEWWLHDYGPLVGFVNENDQRRPVALIRVGELGYDAVTPGSRRRVDATFAQAFSPTAQMFLPPFPAGKLTARRIFAFAAQRMVHDSAFLLGIGLAGSCLGLITPIVARRLFDDVVPGADRSGLRELILLLVVFGLVGVAFELVRGILLLRIEGRMQVKVEAALMDRLLRLPVGFFRKYTAGDLAGRLMGISTVRRILSSNVLNSVLTGAFSFVNLALLFQYDTMLAFVGLGLAGVAILVLVISALISLRAQRVVADEAGHVSGLLLQLLSGVSKLRVSGAERRAFAVWATRFTRQRRMDYSAGAAQNWFEIFHAVFPILTSVAFFLVLYLSMRVGSDGAQVSSGPHMSTGEFVASLSAFGQFLGGMLGLGSAVVGSLVAIPLLERATPILDAPLEMRPDAVDPGELQGAIELQQVSFCYDEGGLPTLDGVTITAAPGQMIALVGPSGSGKSTLLRLLLGLEHPTSGSIYFDGKDLSSLDIDAVRRQIGVVLQNGGLMAGDIYHNIVGESTHLTVDDAWQAAQMAGLEEDIRAMPMGLHTIVGEGATTFSGGQRQRLMIARALVHRPRLLFLDEATSALDNRTQQVVSESLDALKVTRLVVAHRLTTIMRADRIYVMKAGRVVESGTYDELIAAGQLFAELARGQLAELGA